MTAFDWQPRTRLVFGCGAFQQLGTIARELSPERRVLIVTDAGIAAAGHVDHARQLLQAAGLTVTVFDGTRENPTTRDVEACRVIAREARIDLLVGLGGGSSIDTAKGANFLLTDGGEMRDYWGTGTGSECQSFALVADEDTHQKMACGDPKATPRVAILDPLLTLSQPQGVTACTGLDAIAHALESAVTRRRNAVSLLYSREAFRLTMTHFPNVLSRPDDLEARSGMLLGAAYAGTAIENSMLGAAHSLANPLTAHFGIVHGQAVSMMLPHVIRFNVEQPEAREMYKKLALSIGSININSRNRDASETVAEFVAEYLTLAGIPSSLSACGVTKKTVPALAAEAAAQWTAQFNPRPVTIEDCTALYQAAL
jgi:alcohol dehydrogenase